jgi:hypothetical protein
MAGHDASTFLEDSAKAVLRYRHAEVDQQIESHPSRLELPDPLKLVHGRDRLDGFELRLPTFRRSR